ncbi:MAG: type II secretion system secretin GspD [Gammaproteobacteria bacterium]|nr:type II secretion system secretin GspD [Gammaproteobacteria bacterium]MBT8133861.1 type II secretion system secretin GspD [Gammaproteobacteria bacterium]NNJ50939.1 type II secretion system secretin GspD [Gammaproteobacteria bacterium]
MAIVQLTIQYLKHSARSRVKAVLLPVLLSMFITTPVMADEITLNLKDADIRALISTVSKFTGKNFIIDPRVKAKVTVISANTLTPEAVYEVFLSVLQVHGYAAVPTGSVIKIVPQVNAKQGPLPLSGSKDVFPDDELVTKIIRLDHVPASQLVPILRPLVPQQGHLAAYNPTNTLIITDHAGNIQRLLKIIAGVDRPDSDELEIIPLKHASASELVRILNSLNAGGTAKDASKKIKLAADDRTNSILVTGDRSSRLKIRATITYLDTPLEDGGGNTHVVYLKYAKAENLVKILTGLKEQTKSSAASKVKAAPVKVTSGSVISQNAIIQADEETNALIITADPNTVKNLKAVIRQLDIRRAQVLIEAIIAEITTNNNKEVGVGFAVDGTTRDSGALPAGISNFAGVGDLLLSVASGTAPTSLPAGLSFGLGGENGSGVRYGALLRALQTDTNTNILSTPNIVTLDNEEAELIVGQNLPFVTGSFTGTGSTNPNNPFQTIERQDVGLTLKVTPQINEGDTVKLVLEQETSSVIPGTIEQGIATRKRSIKTSVLVDDGGILILGGLIQEEVSDTESKVPLLGDIPVIGFLFRTENTTRTKANLMVFLRPSILRDHKDATFVTNEKYSHLRGVESGAYNKEDGSFGLLDDAAPRLPPIEEIDRSKQTIEKSKVNIDSVEDISWDEEDGFL